MPLQRVAERRRVEGGRDFKKNAKFPGFRVGTIPAFMMPKVSESASEREAVFDQTHVRSHCTTCKTARNTRHSLTGRAPQKAQ